MQQLADFMEREAGHFAVSLVLILLGALLWKFNVPKAEDLILLGTGYIGRSMVGAVKPRGPANE